jgi:hypothetical protein
VKLWPLPRSIVIAFAIFNIYLVLAYVWFSFEKYRSPTESIALSPPPAFFQTQPIKCVFYTPLITGENTTMKCSIAHEIAIELNFESAAPVTSQVMEEADSEGHFTERTYVFVLTPRHAGPTELFFRVWFVDRASGVGPLPPAFATHATVEVLDGWGEILTKTAYIFAGVGGSCFLVVLIVRAVKSRARQVAVVEQKIATAEDRAERAPEKARYAWDLARVKLEAYFDRNLLQVNQVFWLAVVVMSIGFIFVLGAVLMSLHEPTITPTSKVAGISGIISQVIGATFLVIYRSTMTQANEFMAILERINTVGMAIQVLDSIPAEELGLKNATRAEIVSLLLGASASVSQRPKRTLRNDKNKARPANESTSQF